jgi:hypothetical protein
MCGAAMARSGKRGRPLEDTLAETEPDMVCLVEAWCQGGRTQPGQLAARLGLPHHQFAGDWRQGDWMSGIGNNHSSEAGVGGDR